jgi:hypothetical protein
MDRLTSPYVLSAILAVPTLLLIMGLFKKNKFVVDGRVRLKIGLAYATDRNSKG